MACPPSMVNVYIAGVIVTIQTSDCGPSLWAAGVTACRSCWRRRLGMYCTVLYCIVLYCTVQAGNVAGGLSPPPGHNWWELTDKISHRRTSAHQVGEGGGTLWLPWQCTVHSGELRGSLYSLYTDIKTCLFSGKSASKYFHWVHFKFPPKTPVQVLRHWVSDWDTGYSHQRHWQTGWDLFFTRGFVHNILLLLCSAVFRLGASLINVSERKNLVSALMHSGFLHQWLWLQRYLPDTERYTMSKGGCWTNNIII